MKRYDAIIIGFGKGGKMLAADLAERGWDVAMVERSAGMYGGTCINVGCIPTKALVHEASVTQCRRPDSFEAFAEAYRRAIGAKKELVDALRNLNYNQLDGKETVTIYTGEASFRSPCEILVKTSADTFLLEGGKIFIDTGSVTVMPPIEGIGDNPFVYTSASIMELDKLPRCLTIIGGGYIGLEFASIFAGFGSKVTILEAGGQFIPREDRDIAEAVQATFEKRGISVRLNAQVQAIEAKETYASVVYRDGESGETVRSDAEAVLVAVGRKPDTASLCLEAAGIRTTQRGAIEVDSRLHTNVPHIWAIGDVHGGLQFTYLSKDDYRIIRDELFGSGERSTDDRAGVAYSVFIEPPLSNVGMTEAQARQAGKRVKVAKLPVSTIPRARTMGQTDGLLKAVMDADTGLILGCTLFCAQSVEVINMISLAMRLKVDYTVLRDGIFTHPSMSESVNELFSMIK